MGIVTLLTDFGTRDEYVGVIKGVILGINPDATIVDLSHEVPPQDISFAAYLLLSAYAFFPKGSVHMIVVDPGVGSSRGILAARISGHIFLAPDNGLLGPVMARDEVEELVNVDAPGLYLQPVSHTFHGRDIFAPLAAHLSLGHDLKSLGPSVEPPHTTALHLESPYRNEQGYLCGRVVRVDHFGNLITNINLARLSAQDLATDSAALVIRVGGARIQGISACYADGRPGELQAVIGSSHYLEIAVCMGNAADKLKTQSGATVTVSKNT